MKEWPNFYYCLPLLQFWQGMDLRPLLVSWSNCCHHFMYSPCSICMWRPISSSVKFTLICLYTIFFFFLLKDLIIRLTDFLLIASRYLVPFFFFLLVMWLSSATLCLLRVAPSNWLTAFPAVVFLVTIFTLLIQVGHWVYDYFLYFMNYLKGARYPCRTSVLHDSVSVS